jgi:hypothetical protein
MTDFPYKLCSEAGACFLIRNLASRAMGKKKASSLVVMKTLRWRPGFTYFGFIVS